MCSESFYSFQISAQNYTLLELRSYTISRRQSPQQNVTRTTRFGIHSPIAEQENLNDIDAVIIRCTVLCCLFRLSSLIYLQSV
jgi:hypothetical protein